VDGGVAEGADGNGISVVAVQDATAAGAVNTVTYDDNTNTLTVNADFASGTLTNTEIATAIQAFGGAGVNFTATAAPANTNLAAGDTGTYATGTGIVYGTSGRDAGSHAFTVVADTAGAAANGVTVTINESTTIPNNSVVASINGSGNIVVDVRGTVTKAAIVAAIDGLAGYSVASQSASGDVNYTDATDTPPGVATLGSGADASGGLSQDVVFELAGLDGSEVFSFESGTSITQLESAIDALSDSTGVTATVSGTTLQLISSAYGSDAFVNLRVVSEGAGGTFTTAIGTDERDAGTDVVATVNGINALGRGNALSVNTSVLDLSTSVQAAFTGTVNFTITGGGALFQLGPDVVTAQQARIGVQSVNTARLGGVSGRLYQLGSGGTAALDTDANLAAQITDEAITQLTGLRGRLGAFQKTTLESNLVSLNDTLANLTEAQAEIRDADFAAESARLTRAQILVQSGTSVLAIANSNPQNALALLR
jgi:flagellin